MTFKKSLKKTQPVVDIWLDMTVAELAACVKKETGINDNIITIIIIIIITTVL